MEIINILSNKRFVDLLTVAGVASAVFFFVGWCQLLGLL
jgi:hypothetical protein